MRINAKSVYFGIPQGHGTNATSVYSKSIVLVYFGQSAVSSQKSYVHAYKHFCFEGGFLISFSYSRLMIWNLLWHVC